MRLPTAVAYGVTQADFPEQDWSVWESRKYRHPGLGQTVDTKYMTVWPCCIHCATWICSTCWDFRRMRASRSVSQYCPKCGGREGFFSATRHGTRNPHMPEHVPRPPFMVPTMSRIDSSALIRYYKDLAMHRSGQVRDRELLWENQVTNQPDELEHRDPGFSLDAVMPDGSENKGLPAPPPRKHGFRFGAADSVVETLSAKVRTALRNGCLATDMLTVTVAEAQQLLNINSGVTQYPYDDGEVVVLGPEIFVNPEAEVICWRGENWTKQPAPQDPDKAVADPSWQRRDAMEWALRCAPPASSTEKSSDRVKDLMVAADELLTWLQR